MEYKGTSLLNIYGYLGDINHSRLEIQELSLSRSGPVIWNCLPNYVRNESKRKFKQKNTCITQKNIRNGG